MNLYADLKINSKLILGYALVTALYCLVGLFGIKGMTGVKQQLDDLHSNLVPAITMAASVDHHLQQHRRYLLSYLQKDAAGQRRETGVNLASEERLIKEELEKMSRLPLTHDERTLLAEVSMTGQAYLEAAGNLKNISGSMSDSEMMEADKGVYKLFISFDTVLNKLSPYNLNKVAIHFAQSNASYARLIYMLSFLIVLSIIFAITVSLVISRSITKPLRRSLEAVLTQQEISREKARLVEAIAAGDLNQEAMVTEPITLDTELANRDEAGKLLIAIAGMSEIQYKLDLAFAEMTASLRQSREQESRRNWLKNGHNELYTILRGDKSTSELTLLVLNFLAEYLGAGVAVFYLFDEKEVSLQIAASYAFTRRKRMNERISLGEGLAGQAALEKKMICLNDAPPDYLPICSGLGESRPVNIVALPLVFDDVLVGVLEIGSFRIFSDIDLEFLHQSQNGIAIAISVNNSRQRVEQLLVQTQGQSEELRVQQEELQQTNEELEERTRMLEQTSEQIMAKNREVESASREIQIKADELAQVSAYKSEFLANMSHELRTPLNSLMILSSLLRDNREGNLTAKQVEYAATINGAGRDLLTLINDILDLSKIESGKLEFHYEEIVLQEICEQIEATVSPIAGDKGIGFSVIREESAPETIVGDGQRTQQILKNLLSNACKFTSEGAVSMRLYVPGVTENPLKRAAVAFAVTDTGIGVPVDKQALIFNAFQQADGSTSRTYGGTGLGLSISRQLARSMGGDIALNSEVGKGSRFTLYLPVSQAGQVAAKPVQISPVALMSPIGPISPISPINSTNSTASASPSPTQFTPPAPPETAPKSILIIEDDLAFSKVLADLVRGRGFSAMVADNGESGIAIAERCQPSAIILDVMLPNIDGWGVMRRLKDNPATRHIPVHFITCLDERQKAMNMGAIGFVTKPVSTEQLDTVFGTLEAAIEKSMKMLLIVEDDPEQAKALVALLEERNVTIRVAESGDKAIKLLSSEQFDCIVLDLGLADMGAFELLEELKKLDPERSIPVIIHTGRDLTHEDERRLHHYAESIIIKGAKSPERLLNEVTLFLHLVETTLDPGKQSMIRSALDKEAMLQGKKVLIVDDDMRNIFSLSSALSEKNLVIFEAENGREALRLLDEVPDIDLVLMDIMMPEMDGYEAMRRIRKNPLFRNLPIIALTAKAMKGDREECIKAGASDYIPKPVDMEKLFSMLRVWLYLKASAETADIS